MDFKTNYQKAINKNIFHFNKQFIYKISLINGKSTSDQIYVFDKGYNDYERFEYFNSHQIPFVTRLKYNAAFRP